MTEFAALEKRLSRDVGALHDYLWVPDWKGDSEQLRKDIREEAEELDAFLEAGGKLLRNVDVLAGGLGRGHRGEALFELLHHTFGLTAATEMVRNREFKGAAARAADVAESVSIGVCASAGCFPLVEEWEGGKIDFETYAGKVVAALEEKGVENAMDFGRILTAAENLGKEWDWSNTREARALAARAAIVNAAWCAVAGISIRHSLGAAPDTPYRDLPELILHIASRL